MAGIYFKNQKQMLGAVTSSILRNHYVPGSRYGFGITSAESGVTADDFLVVWRQWPEYDDDENDSFEDTSLGILTDEFGINSINIVFDEEDVSRSIDCAIVRKSDRKAIRFNSSNCENISISDLSIISDFANYPELQRLRLLGII